MKKLFTLYILVLLSFISFNSSAYTYIYSGNVSGNWTSSGSPYYVFGDITIADNTTLTIDPGVEVYFVGHYKLAVQGRLLAIGQDSNFISIKAYYISTGFKGIRFDNTASTNDSSKLVYCNILYGKANAGTFEEKQGGALFVKGFSKLLVQNCVISNNLATNYGGAISCRTGASPTISNNIICNNQSGSNGGAIYMYSSSNPLLVGNTIVNNYASSSGGGIYANGTTPYITNSIIYGNEAAYSADNLYPSTLNIVYFCDIEGGYSNGYYNIDADPLFISPSSSTGTSSQGFNSNWRLQSSSPCIDEGYQSISFGFDPLYDLDGYIRVDHDDMDMGAYEYVQSTQFCGNITTNTSWSGQILVNCDVTVNHGVTLSIAPGTKVLFNGHHKFEIKGRVLAQGSKDSFIIMSAYYKNVGWKGIRYSGVSSSNDTTKFQYCKITYGKANGTSYPDYYGGGFYITGGKIIVENCMIANNYSSRYGGGIYATSLNGTSRISNNLMVNNEAEYYGGGMFLSSCSGIIANNTLSKNQVNLYYGGAAYIYNVPNVINCIFYDNYRTNASSYKELYTGGSTSITYSCIEGGFSGTGNISSDPLFTYPSYSSGIDYDGLSYRDWSLQSTSPCINAGSPSITGLYLPTNDLVGKERVFNSIVDMGPYEDKSFITVCGNISNNTTWDANKVKITCDVTVQPGVTLTIDPGVIVEFQGNFSIRVKGNILAEGTLTDSIQFTPINSWTGWAGLLYDSISGSQDSSLFKYCIFDHANRAATNRYFDGGGAIMIRSFGKIRMNYSRFSNNRSQGASSSQYDRGGAISIYACSPIIQNNIFLFSALQHPRNFFE
mgnify:FL=1